MDGAVLLCDLIMAGIHNMQDRNRHGRLQFRVPMVGRVAGDDNDLRAKRSKAMTPSVIAGKGERACPRIAAVRSGICGMFQVTTGK